MQLVNLVKYIGCDDKQNYVTKLRGYNITLLFFYFFY